MNVIDPIVITDSMLTSSTACETMASNNGTSVEWSAIGFNLYDTVKITTAGVKTDTYLCIQTHATSKPPASNPSYWTYLDSTYYIVWSATTWQAGDQVYVAATASEPVGLIHTYKAITSAVAGDVPGVATSVWLHTGDTYQIWASGSTYALGDRVLGSYQGLIKGNEHTIYESLTAGNLNNQVTDSTNWLEIGSNNKWSMFDFTRNTQTTIGQNYSLGIPRSTDTTMTIVVTPGVRIDSIALLGMDANYVGIKVHSPSYSNPSHNVIPGAALTPYSAGDPSLCYDSGTINLKKRETTTHYQYYFKGFETVPSYAVFDIPPNIDNVITITLNSTVGKVSVGACCIGLHENIGTIQYGAENDVLNYSTFERNFDGSTSALVPRRNVPKTVQQIWIDKIYINNVRVLRDALAGTVAVWCGLDDNNQSDYYEAVLVLGVYKRFSINLASPSHAVISLELEEY